MNKLDKKAKILECIISEYIKTSAPIGSHHLQSIIGIELSSATIRNYLKRMVDEGILVQFHISGGRVPSLHALKEFWIERLTPIQSVEVGDLRSVAAASKEYKIASILKINESDKLVCSYLAGSKFVVAEFEKGEVLLRGGTNLKAFMDEFIGLDVSQIKDVALHYGVSEVYNKLSEYMFSKETNVVNKEELLEIAKQDYEWGMEKMPWFMDGKVASEIKRGIYFRNLIPDGYMAVKTEAVVDGRNAEMLYVGHLSRDFGGFLCALN
jgi:heat-inducible transcriptional repressor